MSATKIGKNSTNISELLFSTINLHFVTSNQISTCRKLNLLLSRSIYFVLLPLEMKKKDSNRPKYATRFLTLSEKKLLKVAAAYSLFSCAFAIGTACFDECFSFSVITKIYYFVKVYHYSKTFLSAILLLSLKPVS